MQVIRVLANSKKPDSVQLQRLDEAIYIAEEMPYHEAVVLGYETMIEFQERSNNVLLELQYLLQYISYLDKQSTTGKEVVKLTNVARRRYRVGVILLESQLLQKAEQTFDTTLVLLKGYEKTALYYETLKRQATTLFLRKKDTEAVAMFNQVADFAKGKGKIEDQLWALQQQARIAHRKGAYQTEVNINKNILTLAENMSGQEKQKAINNLGYAYLFLKQFDAAVAEFKKVLTTGQQSDDSKAVIHQNLGIFYQNMQEYDSAIAHFSIAAQTLKRLDDREDEGFVYDFLALSHYQNNDSYNALQYVQKAIDLAEKHNLPRVLSDAYRTKSIIHEGLYEYEDALHAFEKHLIINDSLKTLEREKANEVLQRQLFMEELDKKLKLRRARDQMKDLELARITAEAATQAERNKVLEKEKALKEAEARKALAELRQAEQERKLNQEKAKREQQRLILKARQDSIKAAKNLEILEESKKRFEMERLKELEEEKNKNLGLEIEAGKTFTRNLFIIGGVLLLLLITAVFAYRQVRKKNSQIARQKEEIEGQATELQEKNEKLLELDQFKEGMTSMIVHDLKNPLNSILNTNASLPIEQQFNTMRQSGQQMLNMVLNILDVHKYEDTRMTLSLAPRSVDELVQNSLNQVAVLIEGKGLSVVNKVAPGLSAYTDREIIERVIVNLLTNAIKYSPLKSILTVSAIIDENDMIRIEVKDSGQGIKAEDIHKVFAKFGQLDAKKSGSVRSTGLGLTFCKMAVEAHGGEIGVESEWGKGAAFWFTLAQGAKQRSESLHQAKEIEHGDTEGTMAMQEATMALTDEDIAYLTPLVQPISEVRIYKVTVLRELLGSIDETKNDNIRRWKSSMQLAVNIGDDDEFKALIKKVLDE